MHIFRYHLVSILSTNSGSVERSFAFSASKSILYLSQASIRISLAVRYSLPSHCWAYLCCWKYVRTRSKSSSVGEVFLPEQPTKRVSQRANAKKVFGDIRYRDNINRNDFSRPRRKAAFSCSNEAARSSFQVFRLFLPQ